MTKDQLQKEIKDKVKPGIKPSDLRKLKRSKSADDIPTSSPQEKQITNLQDQIQFHSQTAQNYLASLQISQAKVSELEEQLKNKPLSQLVELDNSLIARHKNLKSWFTQYSKNKELDKELIENVDEASNELISQDQTISQLRIENNQLKLTNQSLQKDLDLVSKLAESRKSPLPTNSNYSYLPVYIFLACWFISLLNTAWKNNNQE